MPLQKSSCHTWTELNTENSEIGSENRDWIEVQITNPFSFFLSPREGHTREENPSWGPHTWGKFEFGWFVNRSHESPGLQHRTISYSEIQAFTFQHLLHPHPFLHFQLSPPHTTFGRFHSVCLRLLSDLWHSNNSEPNIRSPNAQFPQTHNPSRRIACVLTTMTTSGNEPIDIHTWALT